MQCSTCGGVYSVGDPEEEAAHTRLHQGKSRHKDLCQAQGHLSTPVKIINLRIGSEFVWPTQPPHSLLESPYQG